MSKYLRDTDNTKGIAIPWVFFENSRAKNEKLTKLTLSLTTKFWTCLN